MAAVLEVGGPGQRAGEHGGDEVLQRRHAHTDENDPSPTMAEPLSVLRDGSANQEQTPPISQLERALKTTILAAHSAEQYGTEIGYAVRFDQESVKCMAITILIGMQGGRY